MKKKLFTVALAFSLATPAIVQPVQVEAAAKSFTDVPTSYYAHKEITELVSLGVINGFSDRYIQANEASYTSRVCSVYQGH